MKYSTNESNFLVMTWSMTDTQMMSSNTQTLQESCVFFFCLYLFLIFQSYPIKGTWKWKSGLKPEE